jgi:hypothetical protein
VVDHERLHDLSPGASSTGQDYRLEMARWLARDAGV